MTGDALASLDMIERFIGFETVSDRSNLPLIHFVRDHLAAFGIESRLTFDDTGEKANLFATLGPAGVPGIVLSGHTDVVPVTGQAWRSDPFELTVRNEAVYGRGVCDMKGFLAIATSYAKTFASRTLATPIHLAMSYDEEVGCLGVPRLLDDLRAQGIKPRACIVGEPSGMDLILAHKGKIGVHVEVTGREAHSGVPHTGVNAIEAAADTISALRKIARRLKTEGPFDDRFEAPRYTTIQTGLVRGGTAVNIVPGHCSFDFDVRYLPGEDPLDLIDELRRFAQDEILPEMTTVAPEAGFTWKLVPGCEPLDTDEHDDFVALARSWSGSPTSGRVGFGTEAGYFQKAGIPTVICGPGSIHQAHKPDEFLTLDQIARCENFMERVLEYASD